LLAVVSHLPLLALGLSLLEFTSSACHDGSYSINLIYF
jgi:hypothetical protein